MRWLFAIMLACGVFAGCPSDDDDTSDDDSAVGDDDSAGPVDADGDGWSIEDGDCDDEDVNIHPGAEEEPCSGIDENCDGHLVAGEVDLDGDTFMVCEGDCDDDNATINPTATDLVGDSIDHNCDGHDGVDGDGDGHAADWSGGSDCDDNDPTVHPGQWEPAGDGLDSDCGGTDSTDLAFVDAFVGDNIFDYSGYSVSSAEDVDGDGFDDILIGAHLNDDGGTNSGITYMMFGSTVQSGGTFDLSMPDAAFVGENIGDECGYSISTAGDVDGDDLDDILIGAPKRDGPLDSGRTYLMFGSTVRWGGTFDLSTADAAFVGETAGDNSGYSVSAAGDVDGDGHDDILIGTADGDRTFLMFGSTVTGGGTFSLSNADAVLEGEDIDDCSTSISSAGDVDGDGLDDVLLGACGNDDGGDRAGKTYLMFGSTMQGGGLFDLSDPDAAFVGEAENDYSGVSVSSAGDVDGDGLDDILIGAVMNDDGDDDAGKTYLMFGSTIQVGGMFGLSDADAAFVGENIRDYSGSLVAPAGDVDGDGRGDLLIGACYNDDTDDDAGKTYLMFGSTVQVGGTFDLSSSDTAFVGEAEDDRSGCSASSAGDVDGDGLDDVLIGAFGNDDRGSDAGKTYLLLSPY